MLLDRRDHGLRLLRLEETADLVGPMAEFVMRRGAPSVR
jgi:hypothetical protein